MEATTFLFGGWQPVLRILFVGTVGYIALVILLRASGKRTMARMNAFDFVITVTLGAAFGRVLTTRSVGIVEALTGLTLLVLLQTIASWLRPRSAGFRAMVDSPPTLVYYRGEFLREAMLRERLVEDDVETAVRKQGFGSLAEVEAVVFESDGELAVVAGGTGDGTPIVARLRGG